MFKVIINLFHRIRHKEEGLCMQMQRSRKTKACEIYRLKDSYYISPVSIDKETGLAFVTCPVYCVPLKTNMDVLWDNIEFALNSSINGKVCNDIIHNKKWLNYFKEKSFKSLFKKSVSCTLIIRNDVLKIIFNEFDMQTGGQCRIQDSEILEMKYSETDPATITKIIAGNLQKYKSYTEKLKYSEQ